MAGLDISQLLGPLGGQLALAFAAGCTGGYAFCVRTIYRLLGDSNMRLHKTCLEQCEELKRENEDLKDRIRLLEERLFFGQARQLEQVRESSVRVLGSDTIGDKK